MPQCCFHFCKSDAIKYRSHCDPGSCKATYKRPPAVAAETATRKHSAPRRKKETSSRESAVWRASEINTTGPGDKTIVVASVSLTCARGDDADVRWHRTSENAWLPQVTMVTHVDKVK